MLRKAFVIVLFACCALLKVQAQVHADVSDVKEFILYNQTGGLGGGVGTVIKIISQKGEWYSYLINKYGNNMRPFGIKSYDSTQHKLITKVPKEVVNNMLLSLEKPKPLSIPSTFGITPKSLIQKLVEGAKKPVVKNFGFEKIVTRKIIDSVIVASIADSNVMDVYDFAKLEIIKKNLDTIKITSNKVTATKLPWIVNNRPTYDLLINDFMLAAVSKVDVPNKSTIDIGSLEKNILKAIDDDNAGAPIGSFRWEYYYPENVARLNQYFSIKHSYMGNDIFYCTLRTKQMLRNAVLECHIDMKSKSDIDKTIEYSLLIDKFFKIKNFVFDYYRNRDSSLISFSYFSAKQLYPSIQPVKNKFPELAKIDSTEALHFLVLQPDDVSSWTIFPDNRILLSGHSITTRDGHTAPIFPPHDKDENWAITQSRYYLFDYAGKILAQGKGIYR